MKQTTRSLRGLLGAGALAALIAAGSFSGLASAQTPPAQTPPQTPPSTDPHPIRFMGMVQSVGTADLQMRTRRGDVDVNVSDRTWILVERDGRCVEGALSDIQAQQPASVAGMTTGQASEVNARVVAQGRRCIAQAERGNKVDNRGARAKAIVAQHAARGTIKSISSSTLTLTTERGEATINITADTVALNNGFVAVSTLKVGDEVSVLGAPVRPANGTKPANPPATPPTRTIDAWGIRVISDATQIAAGRVEAISGNTVTLKGPGNKDGLTVKLDSATAYKSATHADRKITLSNATQADVKVGSMITVEGLKSSDGKSVQAKAVIITPAKERPAKEKPSTP